MPTQALHRAKLRRRLRRTQGHMPSLYFAYGLFQANYSAADTLVLVFAAHVLLAGSRDLGPLDSMSTLGYTVAAFALGFCARRLSTSRALLVWSFLLNGLPILLLSAIGDLRMTFFLAALMGVFMALPTSLVPSYLSYAASPTLRGEVYGRLSASANLSGAFGLVFAWAWLVFFETWQGKEMGERSLFLVLGLGIVVAAFRVWYAPLVFRNQDREVLVQPYHPRRRLSQGSPKSLPPPATQRSNSSTSRSSSVAIFRDNWMIFYLLTGLLYLGLGMSFTGATVYLLDALKVPGAVLMAMLLLFRLASWPVSSSAGRMVEYLTPLRLQQVAGFWRFLTIMALSLAVLLPIGPWSLVIAAVIFILCGVSSGVQGVTGMTAATEMAPRRYQGTAIFFFNAVSNGGVGLGAWLTGIVSDATGSFPLLLAVSGLCIGAALWLQNRY